MVQYLLTARAFLASYLVTKISSEDLKTHGSESKQSTTETNVLSSKLTCKVKTHHLD